MWGNTIFFLLATTDPQVAVKLEANLGQPANSAQQHQEMEQVSNKQYKLPPSLGTGAF